MWYTSHADRSGKTTGSPSGVQDTPQPMGPIGLNSLILRISSTFRVATSMRTRLHDSIQLPYTYLLSFDQVAILIGYVAAQNLSSEETA
jgi:hypothetical protein